MTTTVLLILAAFAILVAIVASRPTDFCITRRATIHAAPMAVFPHVDDLHKYQAWSPWARLDPAAQTRFTGPVAGNGAVFEWSGNNKIGAGRMTVTASRPGELVQFRLEFMKPFKATHTAEFTFRPEGEQTIVTWSMSGQNNFMGKAMGLFINCDRMVGAQFEQGLANLKNLAEAAPRI